MKELVEGGVRILMTEYMHTQWLNDGVKKLNIEKA